MTLMLVVNVIDTPEEWGIVGVIVAIVSLLLWWMRRDALANSRRADETTREFLRYLQTHGSEMAATLQASTTALQVTAKSVELMGEEVRREGERARQRHVEMIQALEGVCRAQRNGSGPG